MGCCNNYQPPLPPSASGVNPPPYPGPMGTPCPFKPALPPVPPVKPGTCALPCGQCVFRRIVIPATMGDHTTIPPETLEYRNVILEYEADSYVYIFSSDGIATLISNGTGTNFNDLTNRPMYNNQEMTGLTNIPKVPTAITDLSDAARIVCIENTNQQLAQSYKVMNTAIVNLTQTVDTQGDKLISLENEITRVDCAKQDKLVGEGPNQNIKTVNGQNLVGTGNVEITLESAGVQPLLVSGENIKTINGQDILGAGNLQIDVPEVDLSNYYTKEEVNDELETKQDTLVSGTNIKTVNGETLLGSGNIILPSAKLYNAYGANTDGALTQEFATTKLQALETADATINTTIEGVDGRLETAENTISELQDYADKTVQTDTKLGTELTSTVTLIKTTDSLATSQPTDTEIPLPVASESQAGVVSPDTFKQIMDNASKIEVILGNSTFVPTLPADPTDQQITDAYKEATGQTEVPNGAKVTGPDGKTYIYNATTQKWETYSEGGGAIEVSPFTNTAAGTIKGSDVDGKVFAENDGTGSVKGWDTVKADIANNTSALETAQSDLTALTTRVDTAETNITAVTTTANNAATGVTNLTTRLAETNAKVAAIEQPATPSEVVEGQDGLAGIDTTGFTGGETVEVKNDANHNGNDSIYTWNASTNEWEYKGDASPYALASDLDNLKATVDTNVSDLSGLKTRMTAAETAIAANTALIGDVNSALIKLDTGTGV